jgi:hypothetical protein
MGFRFSRMDPVKVIVSLIPEEDGGLSFVGTWTAKGKILFVKTTFGSYEKVESQSPAHLMRPWQSVRSLGIEMETPLGAVYICPLDDKKHVRVRDTEGVEHDWPFDYAVGNAFVATFSENDAAPS